MAMNRQPPVSIFIVTYLTSEERGAVLRRTCEAALAQRYPEFEVVVSENPGPVQAGDALASITDPRLRVVRSEENEGFVGNANRCVKLCRYDTIKMLCDDDLMHPDYLAQTVPLVDDDTLVVVDVQKFNIGDDPAELSERLEQPLDFERRTSGYGNDLWNLSYAPSSIPSATLFTRALFERLGEFDKNTVTADWDFFIEVGLHGNIVHVKHPLCYVGVWPGSLTEEMLAKPFFYPSQGLYTKFRVLHRKKLTVIQKSMLLGHLLKEFLWQSLRPMRKIHRTAYHSGYRDYAGRFLKLLFAGRANTSERPCQLP